MGRGNGGRRFRILAFSGPTHRNRGRFAEHHTRSSDERVEIHSPQAQRQGIPVRRLQETWGQTGKGNILQVSWWMEASGRKHRTERRFQPATARPSDLHGRGLLRRNAAPLGNVGQATDDDRDEEIRQDPPPSRFKNDLEVGSEPSTTFAKTGVGQMTATLSTAYIRASWLMRPMWQDELRPKRLLPIREQSLSA